MTNGRRRNEHLSTLRRVDKVTAPRRPTERARLAEICVTLGVVARRVGDGIHFARHRNLPTSQADSSGTTTRVTPASVAAVVTVLCRVWTIVLRAN